MRLEGIQHGRLRRGRPSQPAASTPWSPSAPRGGLRDPADRPAGQLLLLPRPRSSAIVEGRPAAPHTASRAAPRRVRGRSSLGDDGRRASRPAAGAAGIGGPSAVIGRAAARDRAAICVGLAALAPSPPSIALARSARPRSARPRARAAQRPRAAAPAPLGGEPMSTALAANEEYGRLPGHGPLFA